MLSGQQDLLRQTLTYTFASVLDIGLGAGEASQFFLDNGKQVTATGYAVSTYGMPANLAGRIRLCENVPVERMDCFQDGEFDAVWCSHVLEHVPNCGLALREIWRVLRDDGLLFVMVPPYKSDLVGGHINTGWNINTMMYILLLNGYDIKTGSFISYGYNIAGFVRKTRQVLPELRHDAGDIETLASFFPIPVQQASKNSLPSINWKWAHEPEIKPPPLHRRISGSLRQALLRRYSLE